MGTGESCTETVTRTWQGIFLERCLRHITLVANEGRDGLCHDILGWGTVQSSIHGYASVGGWLPSESATCWMSAATPLPLLVVFLLPVPAMYTCSEPPFGAASAYQAANCGIPVRASQLSSAEPPLLTCPPDSAKRLEDIAEEMPSGAGLFGHVGNSDAHRDVRCCPVAVRGL